MSWLNTIEKEDLYKECAELKKVSRGKNDMDSLINQVRNIKATSYVSVGSRSIAGAPNVGGYGMGKSGMRGTRIAGFGTFPSYSEKSKKVPIKNYNKKSVKEFDENKSKYWDYVKKEIRILVCTDNNKYAKLRNKLDKLASKGDTAFVATISSVIAGSLGVAAGFVSGFVAIALYGIIKVSINAYCKMTAV